MPLPPLPQTRMLNGHQGLDPTLERQSFDGQETSVPLSLTPLDLPLLPQGSPSFSVRVVTDNNMQHPTTSSVPQDHYRSIASSGHEMPLPRISLEQPPPYSFSAGGHGSTMITTGATPPTEEHLFQVQELTPPVFGSGLQPTQHQFVCANPMHDQQYLLVGSGNGLHSVDLTLPADKQVIRTHIQGIGFKEIHCLEDIGLVVMIAGRNARVRCYDYDAIKRLVSYGHSKEGQGRVVEGGTLGAMKNMIQLRVETAFQKDDSQGTSGSPKSSPGGQSTANRVRKGSSPVMGPYPLQSHHHHHSSSIDRSLLSPTSHSDGLGHNLDSKTIGEDSHELTTSLPTTATTGTTIAAGAAPVIATSSSPSASLSSPPTAKNHRQRPMSFGGLASLAHDHIKGRDQPPQSNPGKTPLPSTSTPTSPINGSTGNKSGRFSQMASYLSQAAANSGMAAHMAIGQDVPSEEAIAGAWDFTKLKQTKDVLALDFHYTISTVYMTVLSKNGIDIYCRSKAARGRKALPCPTISSGSVAGAGSGSRPSGTGGRSTGSETPGRLSTSSLGGVDIYEWRQVKQFYHPEAPSFMTVVKNPHEVTDIILGKGPRAYVINVETMSVTGIQRQESGGVIQGISRKLGFKSSVLWHSFERIPFDVPPHILYPEAAGAMYGRGDYKEQYATYESEQRDRRYDRSSVLIDSYSLMSDAGRRSHDDIIQRPGDQQSIYQEQLEEQERAEAETLALKLQQTQLQGLRATQTQGPSSSSVSSSSSSSSNLAQLPTTTQANSGSSSKGSKKTRMVTSDEVLNMAFSQRTASKLFLATYGSQSRIVDLHGKPQSPVVLEWGSFPPQKVEFLKTEQDIYVVGFEKTSIVVFSLSRAKKIKEFSKKDLVHAADTAIVVIAPTTSVTPSPSAATTPVPTTITSTSDATQHLSNDNSNPSTTMAAPLVSSLSSSLTASVMTGTGSGIKFLGRDNIADDSLAIFFSYHHPRNGVSICKLSIVPLLQDDLELIGYYP
ncbi:hypothetical protein BGZ65_011449 [Modicella reniformis]|uniref:CNH domain-containing protein n=1 Tax=Modicella reniformis TaxID=1440133 RepID=A0A9P6MJU2_9FUNG|nr:hypothetical protein BGZ65_011449 [Modicella reniformis]